jgi:tRNA(Ile)-lysidine synthase
MARRALGAATLAAVLAVENRLTTDDRLLIVACSGGVDSTALAIASVEAARRRRLAVAGVVIDHGLQPGSAEVAVAAVARLVDLGLDDTTVARVQVQRSGAGLEADARTVRYAALERIAATRSATVLLGHTLDDQAETVLLGLARGSGLRSLAGMPVRRGCLLRPFLELRRETTVAVCAEAGIETWSDPQNADPSFTRVRVRERVLPVLETELGPGIAEALARTAGQARGDAEVLDRLAEEALAAERAESDAEAGDGGLGCARLAALPPPLRRRVLHRWLIDGGVSDLNAGHLTSVEALVSSWRGQRWIEVPGARVQRTCDRLVIVAG